jgi:hypothetical protein
MKSDSPSKNNPVPAPTALPIGVVKSGTTKAPSGPLPLGVVKIGTVKAPKGPLPLGVVKIDAWENPISRWFDKRKRGSGSGSV